MFSIKDCLNFTVLLISSYACLVFLNVIENRMHGSFFINTLATYTFIDCFYSKIDMIIHHVLVLTIIALGKIYNFNLQDYMTISYYLLKVELSTVPLQFLNLTTNLLKVYPKNYYLCICKNVFQCIFIISFIVLRIINFPLEYFSNSDILCIFKKYDLIIISVCILTCLYLLNVYWLYRIYLKFMTK